MIEPRPWSLSASRALLGAAGDLPTLSSVAVEVSENLAQLWRIRTDDARGWLVTRVEEGPHGLELVIVLGAGQGARPVIHWVRALARAHGINRIRTHVTRPGLVRLYQRAGFRADQIVMVCSDGQ